MKTGLVQESTTLRLLLPRIHPVIPSIPRLPKTIKSKPSFSAISTMVFCGRLSFNVVSIFRSGEVSRILFLASSRLFTHISLKHFWYPRNNSAAVRGVNPSMGKTEIITVGTTVISLSESRISLRSLLYRLKLSQMVLNHRRQQGPFLVLSNKYLSFRARRHSSRHTAGAFQTSSWRLHLLGSDYIVDL